MNKRHFVRLIQFIIFFFVFVINLVFQSDFPLVSVARPQKRKRCQIEGAFPFFNQSYAEKRDEGIDCSIFYLVNTFQSHFTFFSLKKILFV
jgi:hypothetical protein